MQTPGISKAKWAIQSKLPGSNSQNTWDAMKIVDKGLQPLSGSKQKEDTPALLSDERISPYLKRAVQKKLPPMLRTASAESGELTPPRVPATPSALSSAQKSLNPSSTNKGTMPAVQKFMRQMNPMNRIFDQANQFITSPPGQMLMSTLPMLLQGDGGQRKTGPSKYMKGVGKQMRRMNYIGNGSQDQDNRVPYN